MAIKSLIKYKQNTPLHSKKIKGRWYILESNKKVMRELNPVASTIWESIKKPLTLEKIIKIITKEYKVDQKVAKKDVKTFLKEFIKDSYIKSTS